MRISTMIPSGAVAIASLIYLTRIPALASPTPESPFVPSETVARQNAFQIFNTVHSALRQWGSSLNHNGMSVFVVTVPEGNLLYHGDYRPDPPPGPEWLAFEVEHAELFARPRRRAPPGRRPPPDPVGYHLDPRPQVPFGFDGEDYLDFDERLHGAVEEDQPGGYLHVYRATAPLRLLYIDGMGAAKTNMGTLDTQDLLLRRANASTPMDERRRAAELCALATSWGLDGVVRMEAGFEVIKCDFSTGLALASAPRRASSDASGRGPSAVRMLEYMRAVGQRYHGLGRDRARIDWDAAVSAWWYPVNTTNPDPDGAAAGLPRLVGTTDAALDAMRARVGEVVAASLGRDGGGGAGGGFDWQGVVDAIVARYADKLRYMGEKAESLGVMQAEVNNLLDIFIDYVGEEPDLAAAARNCAAHYLSAAQPASPEDRAIWAALEEVSRAVCSELFRVRRLVVEDPGADEQSLGEAMDVVRALMRRLGWTRWRDCPSCPSNEVCFVAMWPYGDTASHVQPGCRNSTSIQMRWEDSYWRRFSPSL